jgi:immunity protein 17 of polymorphic toxin system
MKTSLFAYAAGAFVIVAAILDWDWFFRDWRARFFVNIFGRNGARVFYGVLGLVILFLGFQLDQ